MLDTTRMTTTHVSTRRALAMAGVLLAVALTACSPDEAGSAAVVGDRRISTEQVSTALAEIKTATTEDLPGEEVVFWLVIAPQVIPAAQAHGVGVSEAEARVVLSKVDDPAPATIEAVRTGLSLNKLQKGRKVQVLEQVRRRIIDSRPRVNPRYGTFDAGQMSIVPEKPNWMAPPSSPPPSPAARP